MIRLKSAVGLALCGTLAVFGAAAQVAPASFTTATKLTAVTCAPESGGLDFSDAHCDKSVAAGTGKFGHKAIENGTKTEIEVTNGATASETTASTPAVYKWTVAGVNVVFTAQEVKGTGTIQNTEPKAGEHRVSGELIFELTKISLDQPTSCKVKEPLVFTTKFEGVEEGESMGLLFQPKEGTTFFTIDYDNSGMGSCPLKEIKAEIKGSKISTGGAGAKAKGSGATMVYEPANGMESLSAGGSPASLTLVTTMKMAGGNPISLTTAT